MPSPNAQSASKLDETTLAELAGDGHYEEQIVIL